MAEIINLNSKLPENAEHYIFYYKEQCYVMYYEDERKVVRYGAAAVYPGKVDASSIEYEFAMELFDQTYAVFFIDIQDRHLGSTPCTLLVHFEFEGQIYGMYYNKEDESSPLYYLRIDGKEVNVENDQLKMRRLLKWFDQKYVFS